MLTIGHPLSTSARRIRWGILGFATAPMVGAWFYNEGYKVPFLGCPIRYFTGIPCPTCGMTRSFMAIARGDLTQAIAYHWFGPVLFLFCFLAVIQTAVELWSSHHVVAVYSRALRDRNLQNVGLLTFFGYYGYRLWLLSVSGELNYEWIRSPIGQLF
jgi:hypothetical protein